MGVGETIGALFVRVGADLSDLQKGIGPGGKADKELEGFTARVNGVLGNIGKFGAGLAVAGVIAFAGGIAIATKEASNFQSKLTALVTGAGEYQSNIGLVSAGILKMAGETGTSAMKLADGLYMIESAGFHGADGLNVLKMAAEGAKVGNADLATVADAVTTVLRDYHMSASQAADATNFLVAVTSQGKTHMQDLAQSLAMVLPFASALHVPLDQIGGALATMTAKGIPAADAATYLRFTMSALAKETPAGTKALEDMGLTAEDVSSSLTTRGLLPTLQMIQEHLAKKFPEGGAKMFAALSEIVGGTRGLSAALQLTGLNLSDFIANTKGVTDAMANGKGQVIGWAKVQGDLNFQVDKATAGLEAQGIRLGQKVIPPLTELFKNIITPAIPAVGDMASAFLDKAVPAVEKFAGWIVTLKPDFQKAYDIITTLKPYIIDVGAAWVAWNIALAVTKALNMASMAIQFVAGLIQIVRSVGLATAAQWLFNIALDANPIGIVIIALAALGAAFIWAYNNVGPFRDAVNGVWGFLQQFGDYIQNFLGPLFAGLGQVFSDIGNGNWGAVLGDIGSLHFGSWSPSITTSDGGGSRASASSVSVGAQNANIGLTSFDLGGFVPGPLGAAMPAIVHGGEYVMTPDEQKRPIVVQAQGGRTQVIASPHDLLSALYALMAEADYNRQRGDRGWGGV